MKFTFNIFPLLASAPPREVVALANVAEAADDTLIGMPNEVSIAEDGWAMISPYGDFLHPSGRIQRITKESAATMVRDFKSAWGRIRRAVVGCPIYKGHPDCPELANSYPDKTVHGSFADLEAREDGLYGKLVLNPSGADLVDQQGLKYLSPYWVGIALPNEGNKSIFSPLRLKSVGLTKTPNIPGPSLTNSKINMIPVLITLLGLANEATEQQITSAITDLKAKAGRVPDLETELANERAAKDGLAKELNTHKAALANERKTKATTALDAAVLAGKITVAERPIWEGALANEAHFAETLKALENLPPRMKTQAATNNLGQRKEALANSQDRIEAVQVLVKQKTSTGMSYDDAYAAVQREKPELFPANPKQ